MYNTGKLAGKTVFITGASRGIGKAIALKAAKDKANVVVAAKTAEPHAKLEGTIYSTAKEIEALGGQCLPVQVDVRDEAQVQAAVDKAVQTFGGIDILVNNASAISLTNTLDTPMKRYDLMNQVNARGTFLTSKLCIPYLKKSKNPHILNLSPPLSLKPIWFKGNLAYTIAKYGMSMCVLGLSEEFKDDGIAVNGLWPRTGIWTAAMEMIAGDTTAKHCRTVDICADAFYVIVTKHSRDFTGNFCIDEHVLRDSGVSDFDQYAVAKGNRLIIDGFVDEEPAAGVLLTQEVEWLSSQEAFKPKLRTNFKRSKSVEKQNDEGMSTPSESSPVASIFAEAEKILKSNPSLNMVPGVYIFEIDGDKWYLDQEMRTISQNEPSGKTICTMTMKVKDFVDIFSGEILPAMAFMSGRIKVKGSMGAAIKFDKLLQKFQETRKSQKNAGQNGVK